MTPCNKAGFIVVNFERNGADRSGLFCVISSVIERMKIEQDVAITSVVEEMRNAREQIIPSLVSALIPSLIHEHYK